MSTLNTSQSRTLWIGEIELWMDENYIKGLFAQYNILKVKIIQEKTKKNLTAYGFIEFEKFEEAEFVLINYNGKNFPYSTKIIKLNWASYSIGKTLAFSGNMKNVLNEFTIYVGDLDQKVTEEILKDFFSSYYKSIIGAKLVIDPSTKISKCYGFVKFANHIEAERALVEMNGMILINKPMKINQATFKKIAEMACYQNNDFYVKNSNYEYNENFVSVNDEYLERNNQLFSFDKNFFHLENHDGDSKSYNHFSSYSDLFDKQIQKQSETENSEMDNKYHEMLYKSMIVNKNLNLFYCNKKLDKVSNYNVNEYLRRNNIFDYYELLKKNKAN